jgi:hypothetical protein
MFKQGVGRKWEGRNALDRSTLYREGDDKPEKS